MNARVLALFVSPLLLVGALLGYSLRPVLTRSPGWDDGVRAEVQEIIEDRYVEPLGAAQERELFDAAMRAYVGALDPFSRYFNADEQRALKEGTSGSFAGIGVQVRAVSAGLLVSAVYRGGPADQAGLLPADIVTRVDGTDVAGMPLADVILLIKGEAGSEVVLDVVRSEQTPTRHAVQRDVVELDTVPAVRLIPGPPDVAYVRVAQFSDTTPAEVRAGLERLVGDGATLIVLDLRQNLGGVVSAAVDLAGLFLPPRTLVCVTRERRRLRRYFVEAAPEPAAGPAAPGAPPAVLHAPFPQPLVVLTDQLSASASEILAGALQDHGRALLVGERTYGKFLVQTLQPLRTSDALVRVTTARYETPRGRSGQRAMGGARGGIMPDVRVELVSEDRRAVFAAFQQQAGPRWKVLPGRHDEADDADYDDTQLRTALDLLRGGAVPDERLRARPERG